MSSAELSPRPRARVVLVHGTRLSRTQWNGYAERLPGLQVVAPDLPGHGAATGEPFTAETAVARIQTAVEGGPPDLPVVLAGHSLGGYVSQLWAEQHPTRLAGLVLIGASAVPEGWGAAVYRGIGQLIDRVGPDRWGRGADLVLRRVAGEEAFSAAMAGGASYEATQAAWEVVLTRCRPEGLHEVTCPVVLLGGRLDQLHVHAQRYAAACRDGRVVRIPRATHLLPITHPQVVARAIADLVTEVTRGPRPGARMGQP